MIIRNLEAIDLPLGGAFLIKPFVFHDERGAFYKLFTDELLASKGVKPLFCEEFLTTSGKGVVRGLHYQRGQSSQARLIWCPKGKVFDVIVDLRRSSKTFGKCSSNIISSEDMVSIYVPRGFAHGFIALSDEVHMLYKADNAHSAKDERGVIYNDPKLNIEWPFSGKVTLSEKDRSWPTFDQCEKFD